MYKELTDDICDILDARLKHKKSVIIAIDGRCASGKTTLSQILKDKLDANVIHMDDFFLRLKQRTKERLDTPGGNVDYERFLEEVVIPLKSGKAFSYRPFDCKTMSLLGNVEVIPKKVTIVEGAYSCHPKLYENYDLHIFMDVDRDVQLKRIENRNGKTTLDVFINKWIPLEEKYFDFCNIKDKCEFYFKGESNYEA